MLGFGLMLALAGPAAAQVTDPKALAACAKVALRQVMIVQRVVSDKPIYDSRRRLVQRLLLLDVNAAGRKQQVNCLYEVSTGSARILLPAPPPLALPVAESIAACKRTAQSHGFLIEAVTGQSDLRSKSGKVTGRRITLAVSRVGRPSRLICDHDFATGAIGLEVAR